MKKARPETLCDKMNFCDGWQQCQLYPEWPLNSLPPSPKEWPTERRRELLELSDFRDHQILKDWFTGILKEHKITQGENDFFAWTSVLSSVLHDLHHDDDCFFQVACKHGNTHIIKWLLEKAPDIDITMKDHKHHRVLYALDLV